MVASAEFRANARGGKIRHFPANVNGVLPSERDFPVALFAQQIFARNAHVFAHHAGDEIWRDGARVARFVDHLQRVFRHGKRDGLMAELRHGDQAVERAFQLADVGIHVRGDQIQHVVADVDLLGFGFFGEDGQARFVIGLLDIRDQAPLKARAQPLFQRGDVLGRPIRGKDDLLAARVQVVERVEKLLLRGHRAWILFLR